MTFARCSKEFHYSLPKSNRDDTSRLLAMLETGGVNELPLNLYHLHTRAMLLQIFEASGTEKGKLPTAKSSVQGCLALRA
jgi:hypothetical protein